MWVCICYSFRKIKTKSPSCIWFHVVFRFITWFRISFQCSYWSRQKAHQFSPTTKKCIQETTMKQHHPIFVVVNTDCAFHVAPISQLFSVGFRQTHTQKERKTTQLIEHFTSNASKFQQKNAHCHLYSRSLEHSTSLFVEQYKEWVRI